MWQKRKSLDVLPSGKVVLVGGNHHNGLGLARAFSRGGIATYGILMSPKSRNKNFIAYSNNWSDVYIAKDENEVLGLLDEKFGKEHSKPVLLAFTDKAAALLDRNLNVLARKYIMPSIAMEQGRIIDLMNKERQGRLFRKLQLPFLETNIIRLSSFQSATWEFPIILKPVASIDGSKADIQICHDEPEISEAVASLEREGYQRILAQRFVSRKKEYVLIGAVAKKLMAYSLIRNIRQNPPKTGTGTFSQFETSAHVHRFAREVLHKIAEYGYSGPIDIEFWETEDGFIMNEINWRSSGRNFVSQYTGISPEVLWYQAEIAENKLYQEKSYAGEGTVMTEFADFKNVVSGDIGFFQWIRDVKRCSAFSVWDFYDMRPFFAKIGIGILAQCSMQSN